LYSATGPDSDSPTRCPLSSSGRPCPGTSPWSRCDRDAGPDLAGRDLPVLMIGGAAVPAPAASPAAAQIAPSPTTSLLPTGRPLAPVAAAAPRPGRSPPPPPG